MSNTWPGGKRHPMYQSEHREWNATHYPGTRQLCVECGCPTDRCEDDSLFTDDEFGPLCPDCYKDRIPEAESEADDD